jgi:arylsulfatase A-like enzyme
MSEKRPNILLILIDDLGARDLGCFGSTFYETPNLDRLAAQGRLCKQAYASCVVCSPSRATLMSGKLPARVGMTQYLTAHNRGRLADVPYVDHLATTETTLPTVLRDAGYQTWHVGKWHLGHEPFYPEHHGFDVNIGGCHYGYPVNGYQAPWGIPTLPEQPEGTWLTDHLTDEAMRLVRERDPRRPFYLNLWYYTVHYPMQAPEQLIEKYRRKAERLHLDGLVPFVAGELGPRDTDRARNRTITRRIIQSEPVYAAMIEQLDTNVGRLLACLDEQGLAQDTLVAFTSDNGGVSTGGGGWAPTCNFPYREGKGWGEEGGVRVCQMVRWPGVIPEGTLSGTPMNGADFYPTFLRAAGLPPRPEQHCDGVDLLEHLTSGAPLEREALFWHYPHYSDQGGSPHASAVSGDGRWKLLWFFEDDSVRLYDLAADPGETRDCAAERPDTVRHLQALLRAWQEQVCARFPEPNPEW